jgi:hypothetical protein
MTVHAAAAKVGVILAQAPTTPTPAPTIQVNPDGSNAPGLNALQDLVNGLAAYAVIAAVAAVLLGGIAWALGERMGLERASSVGKSGVIAGFGLAFLVGAAAAFVNFFLETGQSAASDTPLPRPPAVERVVGQTVAESPYFLYAAPPSSLL